MESRFPSSQDKQERQRALLAKLEGRLFRASRLEEPKRAPLPASIDNLIPGLEPLETAAGLVSKMVLRVPLDGRPTPQGVRFPHGEEARALRPGVVAELARDVAFRGVPLEAIAFLDSETTGLSGGTGTYVFLVGLGFFDGGDFVVEQYFMRDYDQEGPLVEALRRRMADFEAIVSYNGKAFDVPLLRTRFIFHRTPSVWEKPHLDLLGLARRLWRGRLPDCSLGSVEREILGVRRLSDVDGAMVPRIFFDFLRGVRPERMIPVFDHHAQDIVSLASLLGRMGTLIQTPDHPDFAHPSDQLGLARLYEQNGRPDQALACLETALHRLRDPMMIHLVSMRVARGYKRRGRWQEACAVWEAQIQSAPPGRIEPHIELAKYHEHQSKDHARALALVRQAIQALGLQQELESYLSSPDASNETASTMEDLARRLRRLQARQNRAGGDANSQ